MTPYGGKIAGRLYYERDIKQALNVFFCTSKKQGQCKLAIKLQKLLSMNTKAEDICLCETAYARDLMCVQPTESIQNRHLQSSLLRQ
ncbi:MAG: hypothetical protein FWD39_03925 [Clostridiales bacterium]|nr:hypothetical protein [Clostridiales bacterium]